MMTDRKGIQRTCVGPLSAHINMFAEFLAAEGYARQTQKIKCALVADLSDWLRRTGVPLAKLAEDTLKQFHTTPQTVVRRGDVFTGLQLLKFLRGHQVIPSLPKTVDRSALDHLARDYQMFLRSERGLSAATVVRYLPIVRSFLAEHFRNKTLRLQGLRPQDLHLFVLRQQRLSRTNARLTVSVLRSFLRFLRQRGAIKTDLAGALLGVAHWRLSQLPKSLPPEQIERLLRSCNRSAASGRRNYAILLLLARLGLRGGEVRAMTLDDLDWEHGEIVIRGKGRRLERLPLPKDVGAALVDYLRRVRPKCSTRKVFIRLSRRSRNQTGRCTV